MINKYIAIQQTINHYSYYVKQLIVGLCEEFESNKVHSNRLTPALKRLFDRENDAFIAYFNDEKKSVPLQFLQLLSQQGEIIHLGNSYYTLPPERTVQLPDGQYVSLSSLNMSKQHSLGIGQIMTDALNLFQSLMMNIFIDQQLRNY